MAGDPESAHIALFPEAEELGLPLDAAKTAAWQKLLELAHRSAARRLRQRGTRKIDFRMRWKQKSRLQRGQRSCTDCSNNIRAGSLRLFIVSQVEALTNRSACLRSTEI